MHELFVGPIDWAFWGLARAHMNIGDRGWTQARSFLSGRMSRTGKLRCRSRRKGGRG